MERGASRSESATLKGDGGGEGEEGEGLESSMADSATELEGRVRFFRVLIGFYN